MTKETVHGVLIECVQGDIASRPDMQAVVNAANAQLLPGGGVAGALHCAAGPGLEQECRPLAPIRPGQAVISGAHNLPNEHVIHCLGPVYGVDEPADKLLADCYRNAVQLAEEYKLASIAFPSISTGAFGYPKKEATEVAFRTLVEILPRLKALQHIRFVLFSAADMHLHEDVFNALVHEDSRNA
ncbi:MAG: macro domain-containing protein [Geobacteraceae bacterium]|nr:macro domain-containing protein [Geobacteraceae bacterium]